MTTLFFYGTLRHLPLLETVLGRAVDPAHVTLGTANGYSACSVKDRDFPVIVFGGSGAPGIVVEGLSKTDVARLNFYEGGFEYALTPIEITANAGVMTAQVYFPLPDKLAPDGAWDFESWRAHWSDLSVLAAQEAMSYFGTKTDAELDFMFPTIRVRAAAKLAAETESLGHSPSGFTRADAGSDHIVNHYTGYFSMEEHTIRHKNYGGGETTGIKREVFVGGDAAILLPYDPVRDRVLLVEQFRMGPWARNDQNPWMLEPIAGRIDPGETAEQSALREAQEEANITIKDLHNIAKVYASPGCNTEFFHIFLGTADLPDEVVGVAGLDSEAEDIRSHLFSFEELMDMVETFGAANAPLVLAALWLSGHRDTLRRGA